MSGDFHSGRISDTSSSRTSLPCSTFCKAHTVVRSFVHEAIQKVASSVSGFEVAGSTEVNPLASWCSIVPGLLAYGRHRTATKFTRGIGCYDNSSHDPPTWTRCCGCLELVFPRHSGTELVDTAQILRDSLELSSCPLGLPRQVTWTRLPLLTGKESSLREPTSDACLSDSLCMQFVSRRDVTY